MAKDSILRVAVAQIDAELGDIRANADKHLRYIEAARKEGAQLLLFPELSLTGYAVGPRTVELSLHRDDALIGELAAAAGDMWTVIGFIEEGVAAQFHNTAMALRSGETAFIHRKLNLATYHNLEEGKHFAEGRYLETFDLDERHWRCGILICADAWNPALVHLAAVRGMTLLLNPVASAIEAMAGEFSNPSGWTKAVDFYAMIYGLPVAFANFVGVEEGSRFWGGSRIVDAYGNNLAEASESAEELIVAEIDYEAVKRARYLLPTLRDSNLDLVNRELQRLSREIGVPPESRPFFA